MKALFWVFVAILCVYIFYIGAMGIWSYLEVTSIVEDVVNERASRSGRPGSATRSPRRSPTAGSGPTTAA
jgi:hypothetical protein